MPYKRKYRKKFKRKYKRRRKAVRTGLTKAAQNTVRKIVKAAVQREDEWGYYDPPFLLAAKLGPTDIMLFNPLQSVGLPETFTGNTCLAYTSNNGLVCEFKLDTSLGPSGIESREGQVTILRRILIRLVCAANSTFGYKRQSMRISVVTVNKDMLTALSAAELNAWYNDSLQCIRLPGQVSSDLSESVRAIRKTFKIIKQIDHSCSLTNDGTELVGLGGNSQYMFRPNISLRFDKTVGTGVVEPQNLRLFFFIKYGGYEQTLTGVANKNHMPEFNMKVNIWYTT